MIFFVLGAAVGAYVLMRIIVALWGRPLSSTRDVVVGYGLFAIVAIFVSAVGNADGGPPNFDRAYLQVLGVAIAGFVEYLGVRGRASQPTNSEGPPNP